VPKRLSIPQEGDDDVPEAVFPRPANGWVGDVIPFTDGEIAELYFLHDRRDPARPGMPWSRLTTRDFATFSAAGTGLPNGTIRDQDLNAYTGSIVEHEGVRHAFYTGYNPEVRDVEGVARQVVMHATSADRGESWLKHPDHTFGAPAGYEPVDFRDPFVFRPTPEGPWELLVIARRDEGPDRRRGVILRYLSDDLAGWRFAGEFWAPGRYVAVECPEVFRLGDLWYLVYSEFSDRFATRYRVAPGPNGPWRSLDHDTVDGRAFYAAKSLELGGIRYFAGWIPTREGETDDGAWEWAGNLAVHEAHQLDDGTLAFRLPAALRRSFGQGTRPAFPHRVGGWRDGRGVLTVDAGDGLAVAVARQVPETFLLDVVVQFDADVVECGVVLRSSDDGESGYQIRLEPRRGRVVFDRWPRRRTGDAQWQISGDVPFAVELERPAVLAPGSHRLQIVVEGTACVAYLDDRVALSARMYDRRSGGVGLFVGEGHAAFADISIATR
jgi:beta-fructofuranosidase